MAPTIIVSSSGRSAKWRSEMWSALAQNARAGTIAKDARGSYCITQQGRHVLKTFSAKRAEIARDIVTDPPARWFSSHPIAA